MAKTLAFLLPSRRAQRRQALAKVIAAAWAEGWEARDALSDAGHVPFPVA